MFRRSVIAAAALIGALLLPAAAAAATAYTSPGSSNMRAGPGPDFPVIARVVGGSRVNVIGCVRDQSWCDSVVQGYRGWIATSRLEFAYAGRRVGLPRYYASFGAPIIGFDFGYWDRYYRGRPFYRDRGHWDRDWRHGPRHGDGDHGRDWERDHRGDGDYVDRGPRRGGDGRAYAGGDNRDYTDGQGGGDVYRGDRRGDGDFGGGPGGDQGGDQGGPRRGGRDRIPSPGCVVAAGGGLICP